MAATRQNGPDTAMRKFGVLLVPISVLLAAFCLYALNSTWLMAYCMVSLAFSTASFVVLRRFQGPFRHMALLAVATTGVLSVAAALLGLST